MKYSVLTRSSILIICLCFVLGQVTRLQVGNVGITALDLVVGFTALGWLVARLFLRKLPVLGHVERLSMVFCAVGLVSLLFFSQFLNVTQFATALLYLLRLIAYLAIFKVIAGLSESDKKFSIKAMLGTGLVIVLLGFIQYFFYPYLRNLYYLGWDDHLYRMFSVFLDPNFAGAFFVLFLLFIFELSLRTKKRLEQGFLGIIGSMTLIAVLLTHSRTGFLMLVAGVTVFLLSFASKKIAFLGVVICILLFAIAANTQIEGLNPFRVASTTARVDSLTNAVAIIERYPIMGVGFNSYRYAQIKMGYRVEDPQFPSHADAGTDNSYLFVLATTGIIGGVVFVLFWLKAVPQVYRLAMNNVYLSRTLLASIAAIAVGSLFLNILFYPMILLWMVVLAGLVAKSRN